MRLFPVIILIGVMLLFVACGAGTNLQPQDTFLVKGSITPTQPLTTSLINTRILQAASRTPPQGELPLGPGDLVEVSVFEVPEFSNLNLRLSQVGMITLPLLGPVQAAGLTPVELAESLRQRLAEKYLQDPKVTVLVKEQRSHRISVIGAVQRPGIFEMSSRLRLTDALAMAGGVTDEADPIVYLIRRVPAKDGEGDGKPPSRPDGATLEATVPIDLEKLITGQDEMNLPLGSGDVVHVPKAGSVYVGGAVEKPGPIPLRGRMTVEQAVLAAGGPREVANWGDVRIYRRSGGDQREILEVDLNEIEAGKPGPQLQKDDVIIVGTHAAKAVFVGLRDFIKGIFNIGVGVSRGF